MNENQADALIEKGPEHDHGKEIVTITVDSKECQIHRGRRTVAEIKDAGGVPLVDELSQIIDGKIVALPDDGTVVIKGGETFVSNRRSGGSSSW